MVFFGNQLHNSTYNIPDTGTKVRGKILIEKLDKMENISLK